jgi:hypothetical protein
MGDVAVTAAPVGLSRRRLARDSYDGRRVVRATLTGSASYATGGDALSPAALGLKRVYGVLIEGNNANLAAAQRSAHSVSFDVSVPTAPKMLIFDGADTEEDAAENASGVSVIAHVFGV